MKTAFPEPQFVYKKGKPTAVLLDIASYEEMMERLEDLEDIRVFNERAKKPQKLRPIEDYLKERARRA